MRLKRDHVNNQMTYTYKGVSYTLPLDAPKEKVVKVLMLALAM